MPNPTRVGGADRYETAKMIAEYAFANGFTYETVLVAVGTDFPDALAGGAYAASVGAPLVLTDGESISPATEDFFNSHCTSIKNILVIGGGGVCHRGGRHYRDRRGRRCHERCGAKRA
ncbi:MAG: hypothetical protein CVT59_08585 [Actinobacteria bacterium HGW-Actinobacteria-1]|nr:MAG: hypothetical protein CVT59_08585 [Actinobacteria bacterium HGW-Actinobacteria-1]